MKNDADETTGSGLKKVLKWIGTFTYSTLLLIGGGEITGIINVLKSTGAINAEPDDNQNTYVIDMQRKIDEINKEISVIKYRIFSNEDLSLFEDKQSIKDTISSLPSFVPDNKKTDSKRTKVNRIIKDG